MGHLIDANDPLREADMPPTRDGGIIVVTQRPGNAAARLFPPLLIVLIGMGFLAYRSSAREWRGLPGWLDARTWARPAARPEFALDVRKPRTLAEIERDEARASAKPEVAPEDKKAPEIAAPLGAPEVDTAGDIEREAEATRKRTEELQKAKDLEAQKLAETEDERRAADPGRRRGPRMLFRGGMAGGFPRGGPADLQKMMEAHRQMMERQMEAIMNGQQKDMEEFRQFLDAQRPRQGRGQGFAFGPALPPPMNPWPPQLMPRFGRNPQAPGAANGAEPAEEVFRVPGGGVGRIRRFQGPNGMGQGFEFHLQQGPDDADPVPPPPPPRPRVID